MSFLRARSEQQIQERIQEIVNAASEIYNELGYDGLSFSVIAEYTKFTRPNIYKYFKTKDEILLEMLKADTVAWITSLTNSFKLNKIYAVEEIAEIWVGSLIKHSRLLELYSFLFTTIEKNVSVEALAKFKQETVPVYQTQLVHLVEQLFPRATPTNVYDFITAQMTLAIGLYPMCQMNELQLKAVEMSGIQYTAPEFKRSCKLYVYQLMYCLENGIEIKN